MKHFMTLMALAFAFTAGAQGTTIHEYPWNPDFNNDTYIGSADLMGLLSTYGTQFGLPPEPCDYDGTPLEDLMAGITNGDIILDSIFVEYQLEDVSTYYLVGCPDAVTDTLVFSNSVLLFSFINLGAGWFIAGYDAFGAWNMFQFNINLEEGLYRFRLRSDALPQMASEGFYGGSDDSYSDWQSIPFSEGWFLDEEGIHIESGWDEHDWPYYANYLHILPYWHYAE